MLKDKIKHLTLTMSAQPPDHTMIMEMFWKCSVVSLLFSWSLVVIARILFRKSPDFHINHSVIAKFKNGTETVLISAIVLKITAAQSLPRQSPRLASASVRGGQNQCRWSKHRKNSQQLQESSHWKSKGSVYENTHCVCLRAPFKSAALCEGRNL